MEKLRERLKKIKYLLLDMDGTIYLGDRQIGEMAGTLSALRERGKKIVFLTNNSSKSHAAYEEKLKRMGLFCSLDTVYTSGVATVDYLKKNRSGKSVYLVGTNELMQEFSDGGIILTENMPDIVVLSYDTSLTYDKLCKTTNYLTKGAEYIATHPDINCPAPDVYLPDIGSFMALIEKSCGKVPSVILGKPYKFMGDSILYRFNAKPSEILMAGDRLSTDILFARNNNFTSLLVFSGETDKEQYEKSQIRADYCLDSLNQIIEFL